MIFLPDIKNMVIFTKDIAVNMTCIINYLLPNIAKSTLSIV